MIEADRPASNQVDRQTEEGGGGREEMRERKKEKKDARGNENQIALLLLSGFVLRCHCVLTFYTEQILKAYSI